MLQCLQWECEKCRFPETLAALLLTERLLLHYIKYAHVSLFPRTYPLFGIISKSITCSTYSFKTRNSTFNQMCNGWHRQYLVKKLGLPGYCRAEGWKQQFDSTVDQSIHTHTHTETVCLPLTLYNKSVSLFHIIKAVIGLNDHVLKVTSGLPGLTGFTEKTMTTVSCKVN